MCVHTSLIIMAKKIQTTTAKSLWEIGGLEKSLVEYR